MSASLVAVSWARFQPRTVGLARDLGGEFHFIHAQRLAGHVALAPLRYLVNAARTWSLLSSRRPAQVLVITPPVVAPLVAWWWCRTHGARLIVDCHTDAFDSTRWRWARPLHRHLLRRADAVLLHTQEATALVQSWGARAQLVPDDVPTADEAEPIPARPGPLIVVAGSLDGSEPVAETLAAAGLLANVRFKFTGDPNRIGQELVRDAPSNVDFTGYLPYPRFLGELLAADVVAVFSTDPRIMNRAAFEAVGLTKPVVLTDFAGLRSRFGKAALFTPNDPPEMARTLLAALKQRRRLALRSGDLRHELAQQRAQALAGLAVTLTPSPALAQAARS